MVLGFGKVLLSCLYGLAGNERFSESKEIFEWCEGHGGKEIRKE